MTDARGYRDPFEFAVRREGPLHVVSLSGAASIYAAEDLQVRLLRLINDATPNMVIDLTALTYISSIGIGALLAAGVSSQAVRGAARLVNPTGEVAKILNLTRVGEKLEIHATIDDAVGSLPQASD